MNSHSFDTSHTVIKIHQNIIRGLLGELKQRRPEDVLLDKKMPRRRAADIFLIGFRRALMDARRQLPVDAFDEFFEWLTLQIVRVGNVREFPATRSALDGVFTVSSLPAASELHWAVNRINQYSGELTEYVRFQRELGRLLISSDMRSALLLAHMAEIRFGASLDFYDAAIACRQLGLGLEGQKNYSVEIRTGFRKAIYSYIVAFTSVRNEPGTTWNRYRDDIVNRVSKIDLDAEIKVYLLHALVGDAFENEKDAMDALAVAQNYSIPDVYGVLMDVAEWASTAEVSPEFAQHISDQLGRIRGIEDPRLDRLLPSYDQAAQISSVSSFEKLITLDPSSIRKAYRESVANIKSGSCELGDYITASVCCAEANHKPRGLAPLINQIIGDLALVVAGDASYQGAASSLKKTLQNLSKIPPFRDLGIMTKAFLDPALIPSALKTIGIQKCGSDTCDSGRVRLELLLLNEQQHSQNLFNEARKDPSIVVQRLATHLLIRSDARKGNHRSAIELLADAATRSADPDVSLPVEVVVSNLRWADLRPFADLLAVSIVLDLHWKAANEEKTATLRRFAFHEFLKRQGIRRPSELVSQNISLPNDQLVYFLKHVCVPSVMDMSSFFEGSAAVEEEYEKIQEILIGLDPKFAGVHQENLAELRSRRIISEGLEIVDSSRVHVDIEALNRWAHREIIEYFNRYANLVSAGVGVAASLEELLREINVADNRNSLELPTNEADVILVEQTRRLRDEFLYNAENGLDSYLSRRVRHHPLTAALRSPVEFANLITTRIGQSAEYRENEFWLGRVEGLIDEQRTEFIAAFRDFASEFDEILTELKDHKFHIRSVEKPDGLFEIPLGPLQHHVLRSIVQMDFSFDIFLKESFGLFFAILENSLSAAREYLNGVVKEKVAGSFDRLRYRLHACAGSMRGYSDLASTCSIAATDVQKSISEVSLWFTRTEGLEIVKTFTLEQVIDIGIKSALDPHKEYKPEISVELDEDLVLISANVAIVAELLLVVLNNARQHGGLARGQKIHISCQTDADSETLTMRVVSSIAPRVKTVDAQRRVDELNGVIKAKKFDRAKVRREGGSGFVKIASVVSQSRKGRLDFGFTGSDEFFVEVVYSFVSLNEESK